MKARQETPQGCYVYIHRRASNGTPFYVGKGTQRRAWCKTKSEWRSDFWIRTAKKHGVIVDIVKSGMSDRDALGMEVSLIRSLKSQGEKLVNMTDGGDGKSGYIAPAETIEKMRSAQGIVIYCSNGMSFRNSAAASRWVSEWRGPTSNTTISAAAKNQSKMAYGYFWSYSPIENPDELHKAYSPKRKGKPLKTLCGLSFDTIRDAVNFMRSNGHPNATMSNIWQSAKGFGISAYGKKWFYDTDTGSSVHSKKKERKPNPKSMRILRSDGICFESARHAARSIGETVCHKSVASAARKGNIFRGYTWKVMEE